MKKLIFKIGIIPDEGADKDGFIAECKKRIELFNLPSENEILEKAIYYLGKDHCKIYFIGCIVFELAKKISMREVMQDFLKDVNPCAKIVSCEEITAKRLEDIKRFYRFDVDDVFETDYRGNGSEQAEYRELLVCDRDSGYESLTGGALTKIALNKNDSLHYCYYKNILPVTDNDFKRFAAILFNRGKVVSRKLTIMKMPYTSYNIEDIPEALPFARGGVVVFDFEETKDDDDCAETVYDYSETGEDAEKCAKLCWEYRFDTVFLWSLAKKQKNFTKRVKREMVKFLPVADIEEKEIGIKGYREYIRFCAGQQEIALEAEETMKLQANADKLMRNRHGLEIINSWFEYCGQYNNCSDKSLMAAPQKWLDGWLDLGKKEAGGGAESLKELERMIGLSEVKETVCNIVDHFVMEKSRREHGIITGKPCMHMAFLGAPGTAKTTVARLLAKIFSGKKIISTGTFLEVGRADLVGKYVGWTAKIVKEKVQEALGGVLFIDEAYSMLDDRSGSFGDEAINTLVQEMENHREDLVVILAGYSEEMRQFIDRNAGLKSRLAFHLNFESYSGGELMRIFDKMCRNNGMRIDKKAKIGLAGLFDREAKNPDFGNGRGVRNVLERAMMRQSSRLVKSGKTDPKDLRLLTADDFDFKTARIPQRQRIGF